MSAVLFYSGIFHKRIVTVVLFLDSVFVNELVYTVVYDNAKYQMMALT